MDLMVCQYFILFSIMTFLKSLIIKDSPNSVYEMKGLCGFSVSEEDATIVRSVRPTATLTLTLILVSARVEATKLLHPLLLKPLGLIGGLEGGETH